MAEFGQRSAGPGRVGRPLVLSVGKGTPRPGGPGLWHIVSLGCCALALWFQICYQWHLVEIHDCAAILDTTDALVKVSGFLLFTTIGDNLAALVLAKGWAD